MVKKSGKIANEPLAKKLKKMHKNICFSFNKPWRNSQLSQYEKLRKVERGEKIEIKGWEHVDCDVKMLNEQWMNFKCQTSIFRQIFTNESSLFYK